MTENPGKGRSLKALLAAWESVASGSTLPQPPSYDGPDVWLTHLTEKTDEVAPGACFIARVRRTSDGHPYIGLAIENGAAMILAQKPVNELELQIPPEIIYLQVADTAVASAWLAAAWEGFPSRDMVIVGITGTDGKTTTANILLTILRAAGIRAGLLSTTRAVIGEEEETLALHVTTPEAPLVQRHLRRMVKVGLTHCVLEATSHGLAQHRVGAINFDLALVTNITHEHLDYHGDFEQYLSAKAQLFETVASDRWPTEQENVIKQAQMKTAVLNRDDKSYRRLSNLATAQQLSYGIYTEADIEARDIQYTNDGTRFILRLNKQFNPTWPTELAISSPLPGKFNVYNTLAAIAAAMAMDVGLDEISAGLQRLDPIDGRMELIEQGQPYKIIVDFAHTPNALTQVLQAARNMTEGRIIVIFGSAGKRDVDKRERMAKISAKFADLTVLTAEDPRTDSLDEILQAMADGSRSAGGVEGQTFWRVPDRGQAIYFGLSLAETGDIVLICGKGHEQSMCFGTTEYPWDDRMATEAALAALAKGKPMPNLGLPTFS